MYRDACAEECNDGPTHGQHLVVAGAGIDMRTGSHQMLVGTDSRVDTSMVQVQVQVQVGLLVC